MNIDYRIILTADAELGTGLGGEVVNDFLPRDADGLPVIPGSHVKGLMRAALKSITQFRRSDWSDRLPEKMGEPISLVEMVFGQYDQTDPDSDVSVQASDARFDLASVAIQNRELGIELEGDESVDHLQSWSQFVSRTKLGAGGVAESQMLRTTEAAFVGSVFRGRLRHGFNPGSIEEIAVRLALLAIDAVGGSRNRGGQCKTELVEEEATSPGSLLRQLDQAIRAGHWHRKQLNQSSRLAAINSLDKTSAIIELLFVADAPVCCPERPDKSNVIVSGFSIPASAVQGIVMNHVNERNSELANGLFAAPNFRCWPMNPCLHPADRNYSRQKDRIAHPRLIFDAVPRSIRVSLTHKMAKFSTSQHFGAEHFFDEAMEDIDFSQVPDNAPLKAADGILMYGGKLTPQKHSRLWRSQDMPRHLTTHGVQDAPERQWKERPERDTEGRTLFSVESMAPLIWRGAVSVPENLADALVNSLNDSPEISIGKRKSVRGSGRLYARRLTRTTEFLSGCDLASSERFVLVLQSPALIPTSVKNENANQVLYSVAKQWAERNGLPVTIDPEECWATAGIRFGWSRHGKQLAEGRNNLPAQRVLLQGSVFVINGQLSEVQLTDAILAGFYPDQPSGEKQNDPGRTRGFGALAVHPGKANELYRGHHTTRVLARSKLQGPMRIIEEIEQEVMRVKMLPSASQIQGLRRAIDGGGENGTEAGRDYLMRQLQREARIRAVWEPITNQIEQLLRDFPDQVDDALRVLADLSAAIAAKKEDEKDSANSKKERR